MWIKREKETVKVISGQKWKNEIREKLRKGEGG